MADLTNVFVKVYAENVLRLGMAITSIERWRMEAEKGNCRLRLLGASGSLTLPNYTFEYLFPLKEFHWASKVYAEDRATSEIYVCADDDQLITTRDFLLEGRKVLTDCPDIGMAAGWMITGEVPAGCGPDERFWESNSIGCPYFVKKGILKDIPQSNLSRFDTELTEYVRSQGYKTGFLRHARYNHLGAGYSTVGVALKNPVAWQA